MDNFTFIRDIANGTRTKPGRCGHIFYESGIVYDYGYHYILMVKIGNKWIYNTRKYSSTTARHQSYARQCSAFGMNIPNVQNMGGLFDLTAKNLLRWAREELAQRESGIADLKTTNPRAKQRTLREENDAAEVARTVQYLEQK